jgi:PAS domain S-box-containing protein
MEALLKLESIFENMLDIVLFMALDGSILFANYTARNLYQYNAAEFRKLKIWDINKNVKHNFSSVKKTILDEPNAVLEIDVIHTRRDGNQFHAKSRVNCITIGTEQNKILISIIHSTEQIRAISRWNSVLEMSIDFADDAILIFDLHFCISKWNKKAENLLGLSKEVKDIAAGTFLIPKDKEKEKNMLVERLRNDEYIARFKSVRTNVRGKRIELYVSYFPFHDNHNELTHFIGVYSEVEKENLYKLMLEEFCKKSSYALDGGRYGIWDYNYRTKMVEVLSNIGSDRKILYRNKDAIAKYIDPIQVDQMFDAIGRLNKENDRIDAEYRINNNEFRNLKWGRAKGKVLEYDENDKPLRLVGTFEDITKRKSVETQLKCKQEELRNAVELAAESNRVKGLFLANMSHEIRTPLNGLSVAVDLLDRNELNEEQKSLFIVIENSTKSLDSIISNTLENSSYDCDSVSLNIEPIDITEIMQNCMTVIQMSANQKGLFTRFYCDPQLHRKYYGDFQKLRQTLDNLISNSLKFTDVGGIKFRIEMVAEDDDYVDVAFEVSDTGIGIKKELQGKIFDQFFQDEDHTVENIRGTGLGLSISKTYAELMGGGLTFSSEENKGTTFRLQCRLYK